ncbi:uncharacterized protein JCM15063_002477 [Sporobolomyces koalae]|uniref:uncharacterized protein n=1 Tax=Sporobolomyces koalae TaxID=500713 RepID=UPI00316EA359
MSLTVHEFDPITAAPSSVTLGDFQASGTSTATSASISSTSSSSSSTYNPYGDTNSPAFTVSWITYLAIIVVAGVVVALLSSRYFYVRRFYERPGWRAYLVPRNGIHVKALHLHIKGPPERQLMTSMTSLSDGYGASQRSAAERRRRRRRNRQTVGETLGPGGTRIGDRDDDDGWDDDRDPHDLASRDLEQGGGGLPQYQLDSGLPAYTAPPIPMTHSTEHRNDREGVDEIDALPSAAEYEALSRAGRDGATMPVYPPAAHVHGATSFLYPIDPPPSFSRANSGISTRTRRSLHHANVLSNEESRTATGAVEASDQHDRVRPKDIDMNRRQSTATASSSASKLDSGDREEGCDVDSLKSTTGQDWNAAGSSRVTLETREKEIEPSLDKEQ